MADEGKKYSNGIFKILRLYYSDDELLNSYEWHAKYQDIDNEIKNPETLLEEKQLIKNTELAISQLTGNCRKAFDYSTTDNLSNLEIADKLQITDWEVRRLLQEATEIINKKLYDIYK